MADFKKGLILGSLAGKVEGIFPTGEIEITENGEYDVTAYETATVNVAGGGGIQGGYTVTFKVDGNDYYVASCQQGESITEPPTPTSQIGIFDAWQLNGVDVSFPYTPSADVELTAYFQSVRTEMEINEGNTPIIYKNGDVYASKKNDGRSIWATSSWSTGFTMVLIGFDSSAAETTGANPSESSTYSYNNVTYYYRGFNCSGTSYTHPTGVYEVGSASNFTTIVQRALDHYFYND